MPRKDELLDTLRDQKVKGAAFDKDLVLHEWKGQLNALMDDIRKWLRPAVSEGLLHVQGDTGIVTEARLGTYEVPCLRINPPSNLTVNVIPKARYVLGGEGRVDMSSFPTRKWMLVHRMAGEDGWTLVRQGGDMDSNLPLNEETFKGALTELILVEA